MAHLTLNTAVARKLVQRIETLIADKSMAIASGNLPSFDDYKKQTGLLQGLRLAIELVEEVEAEISNEGTK